jgi:hypothetical protein
MTTPQLDKTLEEVIIHVDDEKPDGFCGDVVRVEDVEKLLQSAIKTTLERVDGIIGSDNWTEEDPDIYEEDDIALDSYIVQKNKHRNQLRAEQHQALSTLKQELLKGNDAE